MNMVMVPVREATLLRLIAVKGVGENLDEAILRLLQTPDERKVPDHCVETRPKIAESPTEKHFEQSPKPPNRGGQQLILFGQTFHFRDKVDVWRAFMREVIDLVPDKIDKLMAVRFYSRRILARSKTELYGRADLRAEEIAPGLWIPTNCGSKDFLRNIRVACGVVGLEFGKDVEITFV